MRKPIYVGLDVHAETIAVADEGRRGEVRFHGAVANTVDNVLRLTGRPVAAGKEPNF